MSVRISAGDGSGTTTPTEVLYPYAADWRGRNIIHDLIGGDIAVSLVAPRPRSGSLVLLYETDTAAFDCARLHQAETSFTLTDTDHPEMSMTYVLDTFGVSVGLVDGLDTTWRVTVAFQEVVP